MTLFKFIDERGRVVPCNSLPAVAARLAAAQGRGARGVRVKVVPGFPASAQERDLTAAEQADVVAIAGRIVREGSWRP